MMAIFKHRLTKQQIEEGFTHYALGFGVVPIYFNERTHEVCVRNWWPEWPLDFFECLFGVFCAVSTFINPEWEPMIPIKLTKKIKGDEDEADR